jgi:hypothetical protein
MRTSVTISLLAIVAVDAASRVEGMSANARQMFEQSMSWLDKFYDSSVGYLVDVSTNQALDHNTRSSGWYAVGLLARNEGSDVEEAEKLISRLIEGQFTDPTQQWCVLASKHNFLLTFSRYGDYQKYPEEPIVGSPAYAPEIYGTWDPNWRGFVGSTLIVALEEFEALLRPELVSSIEESLHLAAVGDTYRVGGVDGDNLYPAYSNPVSIKSCLEHSLTATVTDASNNIRLGR